MKKNIYVIIGEGRCGKSSLVRALTGVYRRTRQTRIQQSEPETEILMAVWPQSAQEARLSPERILNNINALPTHVPNVLLVLRFGPHHIPFNASDYIDLLSENHNIVQVVFMSSREDVPEIPTPGTTNPLRSSMSRAVNSNAAMVREWWNWM